MSMFDRAQEEALKSRSFMGEVVSTVQGALERRAQASADKELPPLRPAPAPTANAVRAKSATRTEKRLRKPKIKHA